MTGIQPDLVAALQAAALGQQAPSDETDLVRRISRRTRIVRRRRIAGGVAGLVAVVIAAVVAVPGHGGAGDRPAVLEPATPPATVAQSAGPEATPSAGPASSSVPPADGLAVGLGNTTPLSTTLTHPLLIVDSQGLALLSGGTRTELTGTRGAGSPGISHDGTWISWLTIDGDSSTLHIVRSTGGTPALTTGVITAAWSPAADVIAVAESSSVAILTPNRPTSYLLPVKDSYQVVWSFDGSELAYTGSAQAGVLPVTITPTGVTVASRVLIPAADEGTYIAGFYGDGLLLWPDPSHSASIAADGLALSFLDLDTMVTTSLTTTLTYPDWVQRLPAYYADSSQAAVLIVAGGDRIAEDSKHPTVWLLPTQAGGPLQHSGRTPGSLPNKSSLVSVAVDALGAIATVTTKQDSNYGTSYPLGTLNVQSLYGNSTPVQAAGRSVVAVGSSADGFLVVQPKSLQLLISGGKLLTLGELGAGPERNAGYYGHLPVSALVAVATG